MNTLSQSVHVAVLGAGSWGTALAALASRQCDSVLWARNAATAQIVNDTHTNPHYLPGIHLPSSLRATASLDDALNQVQNPDGTDGLIILGVPVAGLDPLCKQLAQAIPPESCRRLSIVWTCKGLQKGTSLLAHQVVLLHLGSLSRQGLGLGVLSGPSFANEVAHGLPVALTIATRDASTISRTRRALHGDTARIYSSPDIIGVEIGGALKNIVAIACGISDGLGLGNNARAALITRGLAEIQRLGLALGGQAETFSGLTGLGDLVLTATGDLSRNRQVGLAIGKGQQLDAILAGGMTAEGVRCVMAALELGHRHHVELPITQAVHDVLFNDMPPQHAVTQLLSRNARPESSPPLSPDI